MRVRDCVSISLSKFQIQNLYTYFNIYIRFVVWVYNKRHQFLRVYDLMT